MSDNNRRKPDFIIVGAMKSGTSSLHEYLDQLPTVCMSRPKEPAYFVPERFAWHSQEWYETFFTNKPDASHFGEASPHYAIRHVYPGVAHLIHSTVPAARIVYIVRDPVERIRSEWIHHVARGRITKSLSDELREPCESVLFHTSRYRWQVEPYVERFGEDGVLVLSMEELQRRPRTTFSTLVRFLGVADDVPAATVSQRFNESVDKRRPNAVGRMLLQHPRARRFAQARLPRIMGTRIESPVWEPDVRARVTEALRADVEGLRTMTGNAFGDWSL
jgi:hypothetical protein